DELGRVGKIDAEVAGVTDGRTTDAQVDFTGAGPAKLFHLAAGRRAAHDRVIDHDDTFTFDDFRDHVELQLHRHVPLFLRRLNERAADIAIGNNAFAER